MIFYKKVENIDESIEGIQKKIHEIEDQIKACNTNKEHLTLAVKEDYKVIVIAVVKWIN